MTVPEGFKVTLFAGEPDVHQPIAFAIDDRGRLWVAEAYSYPIRVPDDQARDRILIFEDTDGDGKFDTRKVFADKLNLVSGIELGFGGVWVGAAPELPVHPRQGRRRPARRPARSPPRRLGLPGHARDPEHLHLGPRRLALRLPRRLHPLEGRQARHARRGADPDQRRDLAVSPDQAQVRGLRPRHQQPLGHRLRRARPGVRDRLRDPAPLPRHPGRPLRAAGRARTSTRTPTTTSRPSPTTATTSAPTRTPATAGPTDAGGGHAHSGAMIYQGGAWPDGVSRLDLHEQHPRRPAQPRHPRAQGLRLRRPPRPRLPPGQRLVVADHQPEVRPRRPGLLHRLVRPPAVPPQRRQRPRPDQRADLQAQLRRREAGEGRPQEAGQRRRWSLLLDHENEWYAGHALRILRERGPTTGGRRTSSWRRAASSAATRRRPARRPPRPLGPARDRRPRRRRPRPSGLDDADPHVRAWTIRLATEDEATPGPATPRPVRASWPQSDPSPVVRLALASALQRLPLERALADPRSPRRPRRGRRRPQPPADVLVRRRAPGRRRPGPGPEAGAGREVPKILPFTVRRVAAIGTPEAIATLVEALGRGRRVGRPPDDARRDQRGAEGAADGRPMPAAGPRSSPGS